MLRQPQKAASTASTAFVQLLARQESSAAKGKESENNNNREGLFL